MFNLFTTIPTTPPRRYIWRKEVKRFVPDNVAPEGSLTQGELQKIQNLLREDLCLANKMLNSGVESKELRKHYQKRKKQLEPLQKKIKELTGSSWC